MKNNLISLKNITPKKAIHPSEHLKDELNFRNISLQELQKNTCISIETIEGFIHKKKSIDYQFAKSLEQFLGIDASFWMKAQVKYELDKVRIKWRKEIQNTDLSENQKQAILTEMLL
jgi:plasmid maintenance system antidote protein VapI